MSEEEIVQGSCPHKSCIPPVLVDVSLTRGPDLACAILIVIICLIAFFGRFVPFVEHKEIFLYCCSRFGLHDSVGTKQLKNRSA